jgi:hypothetical protein
MSSEAQKITFSLQLSKNNNLATLFSSSSYATHDGKIMLTALVTTLIKDEEEWLWQAAIPAPIAKVILEQHHQE